MCGISGVTRFGEDLITGDMLKLMLCELESRGADATGVAAQFVDGGISIFKSYGPAWTVVKSKEFEAYLDTILNDNLQTVILHNRYSTIGNPQEVKNDHPLSLGKAAIVHNGGISNHHQLFARWNYPRSAETDSDIIRAVVDAKGITPEAIRQLNDLDGSCAAACVHPEYPGKLLLLRSGSPLEAAKVGTNLFFASTKQAIYLGCRPWTQWKGFWCQAARAEIQWLALPKDSAFIVGRDGLEFHEKFNTCRAYYTPDYSKVRTEFQTRQEQFSSKPKKWNWCSDCKMFDDDPRYAEAHAKHQGTQSKIVTFKKEKGKTLYIVCPNKDCGTTLTMPAKFKDRPLWTLTCPDCKKFLAEEPEKATN